MYRDPKNYGPQMTSVHEALDVISNFQFVDKKGDTPTDKLQDVWDKIGLTAQQKLSLLVKYTSNSEESFKLNDSYNQWHRCLNFAQQYHEAYEALKDFMRFEFVGVTQQKSFILALLKNFHLAEDNLLLSGKQLHEEFGDDLIVYRKRASDLVMQRREKRPNILIEHHIQETDL